MAALNGNSSDAELWAAYHHNASYQEDGSRAKALALVTGCRILRRPLPLSAGRSPHSVTRQSLDAEIAAAQQWLDALPASAGNRGPENIDPTRKTKSEFWPAEEVIARGYGIAAFHNADVDPDKNDGFQDGIHALLDQGGRAPDAWGTIAAWAWGASRCLDYFETDPDVARDKVAVIGHSRGGKTALWAGAEDERFSLVCSNDSGCGGAALSRRKNKEKETVAKINKGFPHWFNETFKTYGGREEALPVDQHMLIALIAPRAVCVGSAEQDLWADPRGEFLSVVHAGPVYRLFDKQCLGASPEMPAIGESLHGDGAHYHIREGKHNLTVFDWKCYLDFADRVFGEAK